MPDRRTSSPNERIHTNGLDLSLGQELERVVVEGREREREREIARAKTFLRQRREATVFGQESDALRTWNANHYN